MYAGDEIEYRWDGSRLLETVTEILLRVKRRINQCCCCDAYSLSTTSCIRYPNPFLPLTLSRRSRDSIRVHEQFFLEHPSTSSNYLTISGMRRYRYWLLTIDCINYWLMTVSTVFECFCVYISTACVSPFRVSKSSSNCTFILFFSVFLTTERKKGRNQRNNFAVISSNFVGKIAFSYWFSSTNFQSCQSAWIL